MKILENILTKNNYWEENLNINIWLERKEYLEWFKKVENTLDLVKVFLGQRRVGKSYILKQIINFLIFEKKVDRKNILYLNLELQDFSFIKTKKELNEVINYFLENISKTWKKYIFIDEVQEVDSWEKTINSIRTNDKIEAEIFITWSNSKLLSWELATYLTWRYISKEVFPFSFEEFLSFKKLERNNSNFIQYLNFTWIPEVYNLNDEELIYNFLESLKDAILFKDIVKRYWIKDIWLLESLFSFLVDNIWNLFSLNTIVKKLRQEWLKVNTNTIGNYIKYLENSFIIKSCDRYDLRWKKLLEWQKKYFLNDLGFKNFLFSSFEMSIWKKLENYVYNLLLRKWYRVYVWTMWKLEIDFIAEKKWIKKYFQITYLLASEDVIEREFWNLEKIKDNWEKYVVSMDQINFWIKNWIKHIWVLDLEKVLV